MRSFALAGLEVAGGWNEAAALLSKAMGHFEIVLSDPANLASASFAQWKDQIRNLTVLATEGERITTTWLEAIAPASEIHRGGVDIYG